MHGKGRRGEGWSCGEMREVESVFNACTELESGDYLGGLP